MPISVIRMISQKATGRKPRFQVELLLGGLGDPLVQPRHSEQPPDPGPHEDGHDPADDEDDDCAEDARQLLRPMRFLANYLLPRSPWCLPSENVSTGQSPKGRDGFDRSRPVQIAILVMLGPVGGCPAQPAQKAVVSAPM